MRPHLLNYLDQILQHWQLNGHSKNDTDVYQEAQWLLLQRLQKLTCEASLFPSQLFVEDVECKDRQVLSSSGSADVFRRTYKGNTIVIKNLRTFNMVKPSQKAKMKRVYFIWTYEVCCINLHLPSAVLLWSHVVIQFESQAHSEAQRNMWKYRRDIWSIHDVAVGRKQGP